VAQLFHAVMHFAFVARPLPLTQSRCFRYASVILAEYRCAPHPTPSALHRLPRLRFPVQHMRMRRPTGTANAVCDLERRVHRLEFFAAGVCVPWRPYWDELRALIALSRQPALVGGWFQAFESLHYVICQAKNLFAPVAAREVWDALQPDLAQPLTPRCFNALLTLLTFFPHRNLARPNADLKDVVVSGPEFPHLAGAAEEAARVDPGELPWDAWAGRALELWDLMQTQCTWDSLWFAFFARLAKADVFVRSCAPALDAEVGRQCQKATLHTACKRQRSICLPAQCKRSRRARRRASTGSRTSRQSARTRCGALRCPRAAAPPMRSTTSQSRSTAAWRRE
jgi:hypothetical protein